MLYQMKPCQAGDASGTGFLDIKGRCWESRVADLIDPRVMGMLPPLIEPDQVGTAAHERVRVGAVVHERVEMVDVMIQPNQ